MKIHHVGYLVKRLEDAQQQFLNLGVSIERAKKYDTLRKVNISFLINGNHRIELVEPESEESPLYSLLKRYKNTPYHICYEVLSIDNILDLFIGFGIRFYNKKHLHPASMGKMLYS